MAPFLHPIYSPLLIIAKGFVPYIGEIHKDLLIKNLALTITKVANSTTWDLGQQEQSLDYLERVILDNWIVLSYLLTQLCGICAIANTCCTWSNTSGEIALEHMKKETLPKTFLYQCFGWHPLVPYWCFQLASFHRDLDKDYKYCSWMLLEFCFVCSYLNFSWYSSLWSTLKLLETPRLTDSNDR